MSRRAPFTVGEIALEKVPNYLCPRCGQPQLNVYYSNKADSRVGAWCEYCNLKGYYDGELLVPIGS
jgi:transcription elongation factor Elf1